jgi:hypothetical protein
LASSIRSEQEPASSGEVCTTATKTDTSEPPPAEATYQPATSDLQRAEALAAYGASLLAPVLATIERLKAENRAQAETIGELRAQLAATTRRPWWARLAWWRR